MSAHRCSAPGNDATANSFENVSVLAEDRGGADLRAGAADVRQLAQVGPSRARADHHRRDDRARRLGRRDGRITVAEAPHRHSATPRTVAQGLPRLAATEMVIRVPDPSTRRAIDLY